MNTFKTVYLGLGGNLKDPRKTIQQALKLITSHPHICNVRVSSLYKTTPVSDIPQSDFINAVCCIDTSLTPQQLFKELCAIEKVLGKVPKIQNAPRIIDIDILFFGTLYLRTAELKIPHPRWMERLFVIKPLLDVTSKITVPVSETRFEEIDIKEYLNNFKNAHNETVERVSDGE